MKKTLTINLSGIVFHIDEDAYEKLGIYLNTIKKSFSDSDGRDEIMADIEARIAEMLQEKVGQNKQVVTILDINQVIDVMGRPEEFAGENASTGSEQSGSSESARPQLKRKRRVFRDPDERVVGGVCSGIGSYFDFDPIWIRLAFVLALCFFGTGILLYIILWIIIPAARTTADKLEMRGEPVNIDNIGKTINEEAEYLKKKISSFKNEMGSKETRQQFRSNISHTADFFVQLLKTILRWVVKVVAVFMIIFGIMLVVSLLSALFGFNTIHFAENGKEVSYSIWEFGHLIFTSPAQMTLALIGGTLLVGIPVISLVYKGFKILFKRKESNKILRFTFGGLFTAGLILSIFSVLSIADEYSVRAQSTHTYSIKQPASGLIYLKLNGSDIQNEPEEMYHEHLRFTHGARFIMNNSKCELLNFDEQKITMATPMLDIVPSETDSFQLVVTTSARGENEKEAMNRARRIKYNFTQQDSVIEFDYSYEAPTEDKWRNQEVQLTLRVPPNKMVYLDKSIHHLIYDVQNATNTMDDDMVKRRWIMGAGQLRCVDCVGLDMK